MNQENKIAIITGFGLILFVGILISDHLTNNTQTTMPSDFRKVVHINLPRISENFTQLNTQTPKPMPLTTALAEVAPISQYSYHVVKDGESLIQIARLYDSRDPQETAKKIAVLSSLNNLDSISPGQRLKIPTTETTSKKTTSSTKVNILKKTYTVKEGDTLSEIAEQQCGSHQKIESLLNANSEKISNPDDIQIGMTLVIPQN